MITVESSDDTVVYKASETSLLDFGLGDVYAFRNMLLTLVRREWQGLYQQSFLGLFWRFLPPLFAMGGYSIVFGLFGRVSLGGDYPYFLVLYCGLMPWMIFSSTLGAVINSVVNNAALIKKVYFPRLIVPLISVVDKFLDIVVGMMLLVILLVYVHVPLGWNLLLAAAYAFWALTLAFAVGLWLAWINGLFRDISHGIPVVLQVLFYMSPIVYPTHSVPESFRWIYQANPIVPLIDGVRWGVLNMGDPPGSETVVALAVTAVLLVGGLWFFRRVETVLFDVL